MNRTDIINGLINASFQCSEHREAIQAAINYLTSENPTETLTDRLIQMTADVTEYQRAIGDLYIILEIDPSHISVTSHHKDINQVIEIARRVAAIADDNPNKNDFNDDDDD